MSYDRILPFIRPVALVDRNSGLASQFERQAPDRERWADQIEVWPQLDILDPYKIQAPVLHHLETLTDRF